MALKAEMQKTVKSVGVQRSNRQDEGPLENVLDAITAPQLESLAVHSQPDAGRLRAVFAQPNIVGVGIAEKISRGKNIGKLSVTFYVEKKIPLNELSPSNKFHRKFPSLLAEGMTYLRT